ncbi:hypothetical protein KGM_204103 [Danaus plexippus plexippus]|uniref:Uncharacterized protein n=1 Tax=Danaus plexippus plexippus TaxID=278856 RepID=A0A212FHA0_DANPL|nr:uncharacterized protein LOC116769067 [Danaus plexippus plexippus]OWR53093.1 hypothetical protein KGM_204103 [Danaus plexippus plexippus]
MEDNMIDEVRRLYEDGNWRTIVRTYRDHPGRNRLLWVYPTEENFVFIKKYMEESKCANILSIGCGCGLLEWMIIAATGLQVYGLEVDGAWWQSKYAPPTFIPLLFTPNKLDEHARRLLQRRDTALLFCYFNNGPAFEQYLKEYLGGIVIIIGPEGKGVHTDPKPFGDMPSDWTLDVHQEVGDTKDFIAIYRRASD